MAAWRKDLDEVVALVNDPKRDLTAQIPHGEGRTYLRQVLLIADQGMLVVLSEKGKVNLVAAKPDDLHELGSFQAIEGKTWNHPVLWQGKLFVRNSQEIACYDVK